MKNLIQLPAICLLLTFNSFSTSLASPLEIPKDAIIVGPISTHKDFLEGTTKLENAVVLVPHDNEKHVKLDQSIEQYNDICIDLIEIIENMAANDVIADQIELTSVYSMEKADSYIYYGKIHKLERSSKQSKPIIISLLRSTIDNVKQMALKNAQGETLKGITDRIDQFNKILDELNDNSKDIYFSSLAYDVFTDPSEDQSDNNEESDEEQQTEDEFDDE